MADPAVLEQHVSLGLGAVTAVTVAGVQQVITEMPVGLLQEAAFVQHFAVVCYVNYLNVQTYLLMLVMFAILVTIVHMVWSYLEYELVPCELSTIFSSVLDDPCVVGLDAVDGAAGWMGLNDESDLWGTKPDVVGMGD